MDSAVKVLQLRQAVKEDQDDLSIQTIFSEQEQAYLEKILPQLEGQTQKLQNPYPIDQLAWAAWIIARLGGWKGYKTSRPAGLKTFKRGLDKFNAMAWAWNIDTG